MKIDTNYISIKYLFQTYLYFKHHFIIKNLFTPSICEWFYSYNKIELNPLLLFTIPHILKQIEKHYNIVNNIEHEVQNIKMIINKYGTVYSSFLQTYDFKLIIPLSKCNILLNDDDEINLESGEVIVLTSERTFKINDNVNIISIDITSSIDAITKMKNTENRESKEAHTWWVRHLPFSNNTCLQYIK